jgi:hypothetical protein
VSVSRLRRQMGSLCGSRPDDRTRTGCASLSWPPLAVSLLIPSQSCSPRACADVHSRRRDHCGGRCRREGRAHRRGLAELVRTDGPLRAAVGMAAVSWCSSRGWCHRRGVVCSLAGRRSSRSNSRSLTAHAAVQRVADSTTLSGRSRVGARKPTGPHGHELLHETCDSANRGCTATWLSVMRSSLAAPPCNRPGGGKWCMA